MDDVRRKAGRGAAVVAFMLMIAVPCTAQGGQGAEIARPQARAIRVVPSVVISSVEVSEPLHARADGLQPAAAEPPKVDKQGRGALIGAGIGLFVGLAYGMSTFNSGDGEPRATLIGLTSVLGAVLGMTIGASASL